MSLNSNNGEPDLPNNLTIEYSKTLEAEDSDDYSHGSDEENETRVENNSESNEKFEALRKFLTEQGLTNKDLERYLKSCESDNDDDDDNDDNESVTSGRRKRGVTKVEIDEDEPLRFDGEPFVVNGVTYDGLEPLKCPKWMVVSVMTPARVLNSKKRAFIIRGFFDKKDDANKWAGIRAKQDGNIHDVFVTEPYKWVIFDDNVDYAEEVRYGNKKQQKLMKQQRDNELHEMLSAKRSMLDKKNKGHERRKADRMMTGAKEKGGAKIKKPKGLSRAQNLRKTQDRMRKLLMKRKKNKREEDAKKKEELEAKRDIQKANIESRRETVEKKKKALSKTEETLRKLREKVLND